MRIPKGPKGHPAPFGVISGKITWPTTANVNVMNLKKMQAMTIETKPGPPLGQTMTADITTALYSSDPTPTTVGGDEYLSYKISGLPLGVPIGVFFAEPNFVADGVPIVSLAGAKTEIDDQNYTWTRPPA